MSSPFNLTIGNLTKLNLGMVAPVYSDSFSDNKTLDERRRSLIGWLVIPIDFIEFINSFQQVNSTEIEFAIFDSNKNKPIFQTNGFDDTHFQKIGENLLSVQSVNFNGHLFTLKAHPRTSFSGIRSQFYWQIVMLSLVLLGTLAWFGFLILRSFNKAARTKANLNKRMQHDRFVTEKMMNAAPVFIGLADESNSYYWFNSHWLEYTQRPASAEIGCGWMDNIYPEDLPKAIEIATKSFEEQTEFSLDLRLRRHDGQYFWFRQISQPTFEDDAFTGYISSCVNIHAIKMAEEQLRLTATVFSDARDGIVICDKNGIIIQVNSELLLLTGFEESELIGQHLKILQTDESVEFYKNIEHELHQNGWWKGDVLKAKKNGALYWVELKITLHYNEQGELTHSITSYVDITKRKDIEANLKLMSRVYSQAREGIVIADLNGIILKVNDAFTTITGKSRKDVIGYHVRVLQSGQQQSDFYAVMWREISQNGYWSGEVLNAKASGKLYHASLTITLIRNSEGKVINLVAYTSDISDRKRNEELVAANQLQLEQQNEELIAAKLAAEQFSRAKSDFLSNMSHEIRTPLNAMIGMTHLLNQTAMTDKQGTMLEKIQRAGSHLLGLINDILDFSKIEAGKMQLSKQPFELNSVFDFQSQMLLEQAKIKGLSLSYEIDSRIPNDLLGDAMRLGQILINFTGNAIKPRLFIRKTAKSFRR